MKEKANNEIDLLLRRMSRQDGGSVAEQHLDVDELSSYAQNALPAAARARYTQHLAECSTCRKLVTELSLSLGSTAVVAAPVETVSVPGGLKKFLANLFSPMVLRYAVPALGLVVVAVIGFVTLRQQDQRGSVAQTDAEQKQPVAINATPAASVPAAAANDSPATFHDSQNKTANAGPAEQPKEVAPKTGESTDQAAGTGSVAAAAPPRDEKPAPEAQPTPAAEPPPPAKAGLPFVKEEQKKEEPKKQDTVAVQTKDAEVTTTANEPVRGGLQRTRQSEAKGEDYNKAKDAPAGRSATGNARVFSAERGQADRSDADTRSVSGRRFRKERGIWTDTAYDSSTATVNVARGSEQFRALVADEPEIKKIAEQLDGEVIVVWKGRAYRIR